MSTPDSAEREHMDLKTQLVRFVLTGAFSAVVDFGTTLILGQLVLGLPEGWAKTIGFILGTTTAYLLNRRWTFQADPSTKRLVAVWILYLLTFAVQWGLYMAIYHFWPPGDEGVKAIAIRLVAFVIAQGTATVINFIVQRAVIFRLM